MAMFDVAVGGLRVAGHDVVVSMYCLAVRKLKYTLFFTYLPKLPVWSECLWHGINEGRHGSLPN